MSNIVCLSHIISQNTPSYGNRDHVIIRANSAIQNGETANSSSWVFSNNHLGTHMDAPFHFCNRGAKTFEIAISDYFFKNVQLVDIPCTKAKLIGINELCKAAKIENNVELLLIRTGYENCRNKHRYWNNNPGISPELAGYFRKNHPKLRCLGFDFISLTSWKFKNEGKLCHMEFLCPSDNEKPILIIEDMSLKLIDKQLNLVIVAPLFVEDGNGGPVTVYANYIV